MPAGVGRCAVRTEPWNEGISATLHGASSDSRKDGLFKDGQHRGTWRSVRHTASDPARKYQRRMQAPISPHDDASGVSELLDVLMFPLNPSALALFRNAN